MKRAITTALVGLTAISGIASASLIEQERNYANINDKNLSAKTYPMPQPGADATEFKFKLKGYVFGFRIMKANYTGWFDNSQYALYADMKTSGLAVIIKKMEIWAVTAGTYTRAGLTPTFHVQQNKDKKNRRVEMNYDDNARKVNVHIVPRLGSQGVPAASESERYNANDTLSAILDLTMRGQKINGDVCTGSVPVFDSKQHYNLRMVRDGTKRLKFDGDKIETIRCLVYYEPVSGFDPEDLPDAEEAGTPVKVYLKAFPELDLYVPIRFTYKISSIKAVIKLDEMVINAPS